MTDFRAQLPASKGRIEDRVVLRAIDAGEQSVLDAARAAHAAAVAAHTAADIAVAEHNLAVRRALAGLGAMPQTDGEALTIAVTRAGLAAKSAELDLREAAHAVAQRYGTAHARIRVDGSIDR